MDLKLDQSLGWYQKKIGAYDKEAWERNVERRVVRGVSGLPKKSTKLKEGLIDVDLVRGSTFKKKKPRSSYLMLCAKGSIRVLLFPAYFSWWAQHTNTEVSLYFTVLYIAQIYGSYLRTIVVQDDFDTLVVEVFTPIVIMLFLGAIHEQIITKNAGTRENKDLLKKRMLRRKTPKSELNRSAKEESKKNSEVESGLESLDLNNRTKTGENSEKGSSPTSPSEPSSPVRVAPTIIISSDDDELFIAKSRSEMNHLKRRKKFKRRSDGILYDISDIRIADDINAKRRLSAESGASFIRRRIWGGEMSDARIETASSGDESRPSHLLETTGLKNPSDLDWPHMSHTDCNYFSTSSDNINSDEGTDDDDYAAEISPLQCSGVDKVSCTIWEYGDCKKVDLSIFDIASSIVRKVESWRHSSEYPLLALTFSFIISLYPLYFKADLTCLITSVAYSNATSVALLGSGLISITGPPVMITMISFLVRFSLAGTFFYLLCVAERTFTQRFLYAKHFCQLTSARRAFRSELPHFRLNKVRNIKTWLSVRSYLKKHGPQQSVDAIVSTAFILGVCVLSLFCAQLLREGGTLERQFCWECAVWCIGIGVFMTRYMMLGLKINKKYRNHSILITEQINLYLHMEQKPHKKDELILANNVLKLAADLLKELESPFKISGICANPYLYNITKVVCVSAFSAALSELLGFKLKLHKIKIK